MTASQRLAAVALGTLTYALVACSSASKEARVDDVAKIPCKEDSNKSIAAGKPSRCLLTSDFTVGSYTCQNAKMISVHQNGALAECSLTASTTLAEVPCQDSFSLYDDGKLRRCKTTAKGTKSGIAFEAGNWVTLSPAGNLRRLEAPAPQAMGDYSCQGFLNYFHENGKLARCELAQPADVAGKRRNAKETICFDDKGAPLADCKQLTVESFMR